MAKSGAVWGIDVGQCALKALRCRLHGEQDDKIVADAFDYIEYPKILSQPGSDPAELVADALKQFLSRNSVKGDQVAISVSGQAGLARFIKLPPVEAKKIPDIVRYEARQQIPFDLNDVIWRYQRMGGGSEEEGFALETEVGLFAMKRDAVARALEPFQMAGIEVDIVQLTPLALYNFILFDQLGELPPADEYDPENPPESVVVISLGTDATDLVVTNGYRVWQRSVPLGGNHFTKALTKELKLTFAKAEHLKRNAATAQDPKAVFQAMRPVFSDLLTELQRSIGYFSSLDRNAKIKRVVALGNAMKLPGLRRYLAQNLGYEIERLEGYRGLSGAEVLTAPAFRDNFLCFGVCYGLTLQGLGKAGLRTNLLPEQIAHERIIKQKKPWAVAAAAVLLLACAVSFVKFWLTMSTVVAKEWNQAEKRAKDVKGEADGYLTAATNAQAEFKKYAEKGKRLTGNVQGRVRWLELLKMVDECVRIDTDKPPPKDAAEFYKTPIAEREELHIEGLECRPVGDLAKWYSGVKRWYKEPPGAKAKAAEGSDSAEASASEGPSGSGWVITLTGHHFHNLRKQDPHVAAQYVQENLVRNLQTREISLPAEPGKDDKETRKVTPRDIGIGYPVLLDPKDYYKARIDDPNAALESEKTAKPGAPRAKEAAPEEVTENCFIFVVEFCWTKGPPVTAQADQTE